MKTRFLSSRTVFTSLRAGRGVKWWFVALTWFSGGGGALRADTITIAKPGDVFADGGTVDDFRDGTTLGIHPALTDAGEVIFVATAAGTAVVSDRGIFRGSGGALATIARKGAPAPGGTDTYAGVLGQPAVNNTGHVLFAGAEASSGKSALYRISPAGAAMVARSGDPIPGPAGFPFLSFPTIQQYPPQPNAAGDFLFSATFGQSTWDGFFLGNSAALDNVVKTGESLNGGVWASTGGHTAVNDDGVFAFAGRINYQPSNQGRNVLFARQPDGVGGLQQNRIAREGDAVPEGNGLFENFSPDRVVNSAGQFAFQADLTGTSGGNADNGGIYRAGLDGLVTIARKGQTIPGGGGQISGGLLNTAKLNDSGQVAFTTVLSGTGSSTNDSAIYVGSGGGVLTQWLREDQAAPNPAGAAAGRFDTFPSGFAFNDAGQIAFATTTALRGVTTAQISSVHGVFTTDGIDLINVARTGEAFDGTLLRGFGTGRRSLNRHGQIAYHASLLDGRTVLRLWTPDLRWRSITNGPWATGANWTLGLTPGAMHHVFIQPAAALTVTGPPADTAVKSLTLGGGAGAATLGWTPGRTLTAAQGLTIAENGTLSGGGILAAELTCQGTLSPGPDAGGGPGELTVSGQAALTSTAVLRIGLGGTAPADFDRVLFLGDVTLAGTLELSLQNAHVPPVPQTYLIATISGTRSGTFAGLPEGARAATLAGRDLFLTYSGGDGNDLALFTTAGITPPQPLPPPTITPQPGSGHMALLFHGLPGQTYQIQRATNLVNWSPMLTVTAPANGEMPWTDTAPPLPQGYYRLSTP